MKRRLIVLLVVVMIAAVAVIPAAANRGNGELGVVHPKTWTDGLNKINCPRGVPNVEETKFQRRVQGQGSA